MNLFLLLLQAPIPAPVFDPVLAVQVLTPGIVFIATWVVRKFLFPNVPGWIISAAIVPILSAAAGWAATIVIPGSSFLTVLVSGVAATWVKEVITQIKEGNAT